MKRARRWEEVVEWYPDPASCASEIVIQPSLNPLRLTPSPTSPPYATLNLALSSPYVPPIIAQKPMTGPGVK